VPSRPRNIWVDDDLWSQTKTFAQTHNLSAAKVVHTALIRYLNVPPDTTIGTAPQYRAPTLVEPQRGYVSRPDPTSQLGPDDD